MELGELASGNGLKHLADGDFVEVDATSGVVRKV